MSLFQLGHFHLHSGALSEWKIDCDALTKDDLDAIAVMLQERLPEFGMVESVPTGGDRLAELMAGLVSRGPLLIIDDVLTTGHSMEEKRAGREAIGAVIFARGKCPTWVTPLFTLTEER